MYFVLLPYPPSINHYWGRTSNGGVYIPAKVKEFRQAVAYEVLMARSDLILPPDPFENDLFLSITVYPPDKRIRDLDNILKATLDALTHAKVWLDDQQISKLLVERALPIPKNPGRLGIKIEEMKNA